MGSWVYRKPEASDIQGVCVVCNKNKQRKNSKGKFKALCRGCDEKINAGEKTRERRRKKATERKRPYTKYKKGYCESCGFIPNLSCQLDIDHIDGDHKNNSPENLMTLCANCHRLKTYLREDWNK